MIASPIGKGNKDLEGSVNPILFYHYINQHTAPDSCRVSSCAALNCMVELIRNAEVGEPIRTLLYPFIYISESGVESYYRKEEYSCLPGM